MRTILTMATIAFSLAACVSMTIANEDPNIWLEDVHGAKALAWVETENERTLARLEGDRRYSVYRRQALKIFTAKDRIAMPTFRAGGVDNLWQDDAHPHGIWRHSSLKEYRAGRPSWKTLINLDELSRKEGKNWFLKDVDCLAPDDRYCLVHMSDGGGDAIEIREFDSENHVFIKSGFQFDRAKQSVDWLNLDTILIARALDESEATESGYPFVVRELKRGQPFNDGKVVFRGEKKDTGVSTHVLRNPEGKLEAVLVDRRVGFFDVEHYLMIDGKPLKLDLPTFAAYQGFVDGQMIYTVQDKWNGFDAGALLAVDLGAVVKSPRDIGRASQLVMQPKTTQTIDAVRTTRSTIIVQLLDNVKGAVDVYRRAEGGWRAARLVLPENSALAVRAAQDSGTLAFVSSESFLEPTRLWVADVSSGKVGLVASLPPKFKPGSHIVQQLWATSSDGTKIPYFLVAPKAMKMDGSTPTLLFGYGGFQLSKPPAYLPEMGKLWLERGGAFVTANIRGGGEFGPEWHRAALREHRQRAFDDFAAVAEDLIAHKVTSPRRLGIYGRSNGGVLTTVSMTQRPELFSAVVVESPLIDMLRYHKLSAGASWVAEYGNPDVPEDRAFIAQYSAYQKLKAGTQYPEPYITTNTEDDRVHPGHARKYAAKLAQIGSPYLYFENTFGGHSNDADPALNAKRWARHYVYLSQKLMD
ncbi:MAG: prolyl oligopeptidase family serine peptidase [Micropepsaceae bacterium]